MSTHLKTIKGRYEESSNGDLTINYGDSTLYISRFSGGRKGTMYQLTINNDEGTAYIQLTKEQIESLIKIFK